MHLFLLKKTMAQRTISLTVKAKGEYKRCQKLAIPTLANLS